MYCMFYSVADHIDFTEKLDDSLTEEPICDVKYGAAGALLDGIPGVSDPGKLDYQPELALREILQRLGSGGGGAHPEPADRVGTRIARALNRDPASWVAANLGALYWRIMGDAVKTIDCVKVAYANAPRNARVSSVIVTAHQQSFGKVMLSQVSVWHSLGGEGGPM